MTLQRMWVRRGTSAHWASINPILASGEFGYDTDQKALKIGDGTTAWDALPWLVAPDSTELYASRATQDTVEGGRLNDGVLTGRFNTPVIFIGAAQMMSTTGTPAAQATNSHVPAWRLDADGDESVAFSAAVPQAWASFDVYVKGHNVGGGSGNVRLRLLYGAFKDGDDVTANTSGEVITLTAGAQNIRQSAKIDAAVPADYNAMQTFRILRDADDVLDTLPNDWALTGVELRAVSYTTFEPTEPEEPETLEGQAFTDADNALLDPDLGVFVNALPPDSNTDDGEYPYYPGTAYATMNSDLADSAWTNGEKWYFLWAMRFNFGTAHNKRPNPMPSPQINIGEGAGAKECRIVYTTRQRAQAATEVMVKHLAGLGSGAVQAPWIGVGGVAGDLIPEQDIRDDPETYCTDEFTDGGETFAVMTDKVLLPTFRLIDGLNPSANAGVLLDFEVQDDRTEAQTLAHIEELSEYLQDEGFKLLLYNNDLDKSGPTYGGITTGNLPDILAAVDLFTVLVWTGNPHGSVSASWDSQIAKLGTMTDVEWAKIVPVFQLGPDSTGTTIEDAQWMYDKLTEPGDEHPTNVYFWRNQAQVGGSRNRLVNQKIATVLGLPL